MRYPDTGAEKSDGKGFSRNSVYMPSHLFLCKTSKKPAIFLIYFLFIGKIEKMLSFYSFNPKPGFYRKKNKFIHTKPNKFKIKQGYRLNDSKNKPFLKPKVPKVGSGMLLFPTCTTKIFRLKRTEIRFKPNRFLFKTRSGPNRSSRSHRKTAGIIRKTGSGKSYFSDIWQLFNRK